MTHPAVSVTPAFAPATPPEAAIPAATLIIARPGLARDAAEVLLLRRVDSMAFAPGAAVFPGGRVDPDDHLVGDRIGGTLDPADAAARVAAIRETLEETGLAVGLRLARPDDRQRLRDALLEGAPLSPWVDRGDVALDLDALIPFARWCPNFRETRTFDTRFYRTVASRDRSEGGSVVVREHDSLAWHSPAGALAAINDGAMTVIFPTHRNLEKLSTAPESLLTLPDGTAPPVPLIVPFVEVVDGVRWLCIPPNLGYPVTRVRLDEARRA